MTRRELLEEKRKKDAEGWTYGDKSLIDGTDPGWDLKKAHLSGSGALEGMLLKMAEALQFYVSDDYWKEAKEQANAAGYGLNTSQMPAEKVLAELDAWLGRGDGF